MSTTATLHPLAADYLRRLQRAGRRLPRGELRELVAEIEAHLDESTDPGMSDAEVLTVLDRLGEPDEVIAAQRPPVDGRGSQEWAAIILLLIGGFIFAVGWFVGVVLLWSSRVWSVRDKLIGTLVIPGGLGAGLLIGLNLAGNKLIGSSTPERIIGPGGRSHVVNDQASTGQAILWLAVLLFLIVAPIVTSIYLSRRARNAPAAPRAFAP